MTAGSALRLLILAAIWGGSFLFMRIGAPVPGPAWLIQFRVGIAALFLLICAVWGVLFLDEQIDWSTIVGAAVVLAGTTLTNGITPRSFLESGKSSRPHGPE